MKIPIIVMLYNNQLRGCALKTVSSTEAQNHFGELLDNAQPEPISITRRGHPVAVILSSTAYRSLAKEAAAHTQRVGAYLQAIEAFRGQGQGGGTARLLADRHTPGTKHDPAA